MQRMRAKYFFYLFIISKIKVMENENYISPNKITKQYDITSGTLRRWAEEGKIRCLRPNGGKRIYNIDDINRLFSKRVEDEKLKTVESVVSRLEGVDETLKKLSEVASNEDKMLLRDAVEKIKGTLNMFL
jgi:predicted site-specific integrase-resolvase